jgi:hypothetical protein
MPGKCPACGVEFGSPRDERPHNAKHAMLVAICVSCGVLMTAPTISGPMRLLGRKDRDELVKHPRLAAIRRVQGDVVKHMIG